MPAQFNPFAHVSGRYGAPMGRHNISSPANLQDLKRLACKHQGGSEGYDRGGAYWGLPANVYAVWARIDGEVVCTYIRAVSRQAAINAVQAG